MNQQGAISGLFLDPFQRYLTVNYWNGSATEENQGLSSASLMIIGESRNFTEDFHTINAANLLPSLICTDIVFLKRRHCDYACLMFTLVTRC